MLFLCARRGRASRWQWRRKEFGSRNSFVVFFTDHKTRFVQKLLHRRTNLIFQQLNPMSPETSISAIAHVIQLAIAPVFLITGVCTLLGVLANRLGRIVDRARVIETKLEIRDEVKSVHLEEELKRLSRRARFVNLAITYSTISALLTCVTISTLFAGTFVAAHLSKVITILFVAAMSSLFLALLAFLREVMIASRALHISCTMLSRGAGKAQPPLPLVQE